ncbi:MAG TPA: TIGR03435 family protein [Vicinamibacterales bacterium]|jgi:uncharacterized protein (TIGR03435 family)|nr:TIGR03435 family protein [Vicinamibacterales bacterium]
MRKWRILAVVAAVSVGLPIQAQAPAFDAASVKRATEPGGYMGAQPGGRFTAKGVSLQDLLVFAYDVQPYQIVGGPAWLDVDRWDVTAAGAPEPRASTLLALQQLLGDRFSLAVRRETREMPVYALTLARGDGRLGPGLKRSDFDCEAAQAEARRTRVVAPEARTRCFANGRVGSIQMGGTSMSVLAPMLSTRLQRTVVDRTGLTGPWDLTLTYRPEIAAGAAAPNSAPSTVDPNAPSLFTAVQEQLGLKLESTRAPVPVLVIDRAEFAREN